MANDSISKSEPLTDEQRKLVADNHNLIYGYVRKRKVSIDEYYDLLAVALCKAARSYNSKNVKFSTFAFKCMDNELFKYLDSINKKSSIPYGLIVSYDATIQDVCGNENNFYEILSDNNSYNDMMYVVMSSEFKRTLTERELFVVEMLEEGFTHSEIAKKIGCNRSNVTYFVGRIKDKMLKYMSYN